MTVSDPDHNPNPFFLHGIFTEVLFPRLRVYIWGLLSYPDFINTKHITIIWTLNFLEVSGCDMGYYVNMHAWLDELHRVMHLIGLRQCNAMQCNAVQCSAVQCSAVQYNTILYNTIQVIYRISLRSTFAYIFQNENTFNSR